MDKTTRDKWQIAVAAVGVFVLGAIAGGLLLNLYHGALAARSQRGWGGPSVEDIRNLQERLGLSEDQQQQVEKILADARRQLFEVRRQTEPQIGEIRSKTDEQLKQVLTEQQWQQFQQIKGEMREHRHWNRRDRLHNAND